MRKNSGYPGAYWKGLRRFLIRYLLFLCVVFTLACFFAYHALYKNGTIAIAAWLSGFFLYLLLVLYLVVQSKPKLVLYFEAKVPGAWVWSAALARNCVFLDELCGSLGVSALSSFGFGDERSRKPIIWHAPERGLKTVDALMRHLRDNPTFLSESAAISIDLEKLHQRLQEAKTQDVCFCFILHEASINAMEIEQRRGYF